MTSGFWENRPFGNHKSPNYVRGFVKLNSAATQIPVLQYKKHVHQLEHFKVPISATIKEDDVRINSANSEAILKFTASVSVFPSQLQPTDWPCNSSWEEA